MMNTANTLNTELKEKLEEVVNINKDATEFYQAAKNKVENPELLQTFNRLQDTHTAVMNRVDTLLQRADASRDRNDARETIVGTSSRLFGQLVASLSSNPDQGLVNRLEEAEDRCLHTLQEATELSNTDANTRQVLEQELSKVRRTHDYMKELKEKMAA